MCAAVEKPLNKTKYIRRGRDPPGQKTIYIIPGDTCVENYRASTFKDFPYQADVLLIASNGFHYTGYRDRVKCFSCGMAVENWNKTESINFSAWHELECDFMNGRDESNTPMKSLFRLNHTKPRRIGFNHPTPINGSSSIRTSPRSPPAGEVLFSDIQNNSTSNQSVRSASSESEFDASVAHDTNRRNSSNNHDEDETELQQRRHVFPCHHPINPHMQNNDVRLQTFIDRSETWPRDRINATPQEIVDAGFFYLGERDRVKCWYCNGGLQNFERNDIVWEEHAKWFPMCEYLLQQKGPQYVHSVVSRYPNLRRPPLYNPANNVVFNGNGLTVRTSTPSYVPSNHAGPVIIDPHKLQEEQRKKIDHEMESSELVANARLMGYSDEIIRSAIKSQYQLHNKGFSSCESLINAIMEVECEEENNSENIPTSSKKVKKESKKNKLEKLMESKKCRVCRNEDVCVVFIPCGHLACCSKCGPNVKKCPICRSEITERIRSFLS